MAKSNDMNRNVNSNTAAKFKLNEPVQMSENAKRMKSSFNAKDDGSAAGFTDQHSFRSSEKPATDATKNSVNTSTKKIANNTLNEKGSGDIRPTTKSSTHTTDGTTNMASNANSNDSMAKNSFNAEKFYKTRLCPYGQRCKKMSRCTYAHNPGELRKSICLNKTRLCEDFKFNAVCPRGSKCSFAHSTWELQSTVDMFKARMCLRNECQDINCRHAHIEKEISLAKKWIADGTLAVFQGIVRHVDFFRLLYAMDEKDEDFDAEVDQIRHKYGSAIDPPPILNKQQQGLKRDLVAALSIPFSPPTEAPPPPAPEAGRVRPQHPLTRQKQTFEQQKEELRRNLAARMSSVDYTRLQDTQLGSIYSDHRRTSNASHLAEAAIENDYNAFFNTHLSTNIYRPMTRMPSVPSAQFGNTHAYSWNTRIETPKDPRVCHAGSFSNISMNLPTNSFSNPRRIPSNTGNVVQMTYEGGITFSNPHDVSRVCEKQSTESPLRINKPRNFSHPTVERSDAVSTTSEDKHETQMGSSLMSHPPAVAVPKPPASRESSLVPRASNESLISGYEARFQEDDVPCMMRPAHVDLSQPYFAANSAPEFQQGYSLDFQRAAMQSSFDHDSTIRAGYGSQDLLTQNSRRSLPYGNAVPNFNADSPLLPRDPDPSLRAVYPLGTTKHIYHNKTDASMQET